MAGTGAISTRPSMTTTVRDAGPPVSILPCQDLVSRGSNLNEALHAGAGRDPCFRGDSVASRLLPGPSAPPFCTRADPVGDDATGSSRFWNGEGEGTRVASRDTSDAELPPIEL